MSGGSFNYLCRKDIYDLASSGYGDDWDNMLAELDDLCPEAAAEMRKIRASTDEFVKEHNTRWEKLAPLLHDIEWWRSNDYGKDQVDEAIEEYRNADREA